jgi:hypothetical protein
MHVKPGMHKVQSGLNIVVLLYKLLRETSSNFLMDDIK